MKSVGLVLLGAFGTSLTLAQVNTILGTFAGVFTVGITGIKFYRLLRKTFFPPIEAKAKETKEETTIV